MPKMKLEAMLLLLLEIANDRDTQARLLQSYIAEYGFLPEETAAKVREILGHDPRRF